MTSLTSLWSKLGWQQWRLKHSDHLKTHSVSRIWCWIMRSFKNDQALIQFWINCWLKSRLTLKHGWRLTVDDWRITVELLFPHRTGALGAPFCVTYQKQGVPYHSTAWDKNTVDGWRLTDIGWTPELLFPQRTGALKGAVLWDTQHWRRRILVLSNELSIITLLAWVMARRTRMVGWRWRFMMVVSNTLLRKQSTFQRVSPCPYSGGWSPLPWFLVSWTSSCHCLYNHLPHQVKRERHYKVYTRTSA